MNLTEIAPKQKGLTLLHELSEMVERQGFFVGQEAFYKNKYYGEKIIVSGYLFELKDGRLQLGYCVQTIHALRMVQEGVYDEPDTLLVSIDDLSLPIAHESM